MDPSYKGWPSFPFFHQQLVRGMLCIVVPSWWNFTTLENNQLDHFAQHIDINVPPSRASAHKFAKKSCRQRSSSVNLRPLGTFFFLPFPCASSAAGIARQLRPRPSVSFAQRPPASSFPSFGQRTLMAMVNRLRAWLGFGEMSKCPACPQPLHPTVHLPHRLGLGGSSYCLTCSTPFAQWELHSIPLSHLEGENETYDTIETSSQFIGFHIINMSMRYSWCIMKTHVCCLNPPFGCLNHNFHLVT